MTFTINLLSLVVFTQLFSGYTIESNKLSESFSHQATVKKQYVCPPCGCNQDNEVFAEPGTCSLCKMAYVEKTDQLREADSIFTFTRANQQYCTG